MIVRPRASVLTPFRHRRLATQSSSGRTFRGLALTTSIALGSAFGGFKMAEMLTPATTPPLPSDPREQSAQQLAVEERVLQHPVALEYRQKADFEESRAYDAYPVQYRAGSLTVGTLSGPGKVTVWPLLFNEKSGKSIVSILHLGNYVCGHPGIVHGGLLATLLDEGLARCCFPALPNKIAVTANLNIDFRAPTKADSVVVLRATTTKVEGRKAWVEGTIEGEDGTVLVQAKALYIEPKFASTLKRIVPM